MEWGEGIRVASAGIAVGAALMAGYWRVDEWMTLEHTSGRYVTEPAVRGAMLDMEKRRNSEKLLWLCLETREVAQCKLEYYQRARAQILKSGG